MKLLIALFFLVLTRSYICQENKAKKIISNNSNEEINAFSWIASIRFSLFGDLRHVCNGVIISDIFVLTAASCFQRALNLYVLFSIRAGIGNKYNEITPIEQIRRVSQIIIHPNFIGNNSLNDLALVRVTQPFNITSSIVSTIRLSNLTSLENLNLLTVGWDYERNQSNLSEIDIFLKQIIVQEDTECIRNKSIDAERQICVLGACQRMSLNYMYIFLANKNIFFFIGDNGSPLVIYSNDTQQYELVGITIFRNVCTTEGIFTRLIPFLNWIQTILNNPPTLPTTSTRKPTTATTTKPDILGTYIS